MHALLYYTILSLLVLSCLVCLVLLLRAREREREIGKGKWKGGQGKVRFNVSAARKERSSMDGWMGVYENVTCPRSV